MTPFFQASHRSLAHQFTVNVPLLCPLFSIFRRFLLFQPCFGQNSSSLDPNFSKFSFPRPPFFKENPLPRPYILKPAWHTPTQKKVECPPPGSQASAVQYMYNTVNVNWSSTFHYVHSLTRIIFAWKWPALFNSWLNHMNTWYFAFKFVTCSDTCGDKCWKHQVIYKCAHVDNESSQNMCFVTVVVFDNKMCGPIILKCRF